MVFRPPFTYCVGLKLVEICVELAHEYVLLQFRFKTLSSMSCTQTISAPPVPPLKAQTSPLVNLFNQDNNTFTPNINKGRMFTLSIYFRQIFIWIFFSWINRFFFLSVQFLSNILLFLFLHDNTRTSPQNLLNVDRDI